MPDWKEEIRSRLAPLRLESAREVEIVEELAQHLDDRYEQLIEGGATRTEAHQAVLLELSDRDLLAQGLGEIERGVNQNVATLGAPSGSGGSKSIVGDFWQDLRYGLRTLRKNPGFTAVAVIALALGIGANSAIFSVVNTVLLRPLPYKDAERLVMVWEDASKHGYPRDTPAPANYVDWRDQNQVFESMAAIADQSFNLTGVGEPERIEGRRVSASLFPLLGVEPQLGRAFTAEEDQPGTSRVVIMSHRLWQRRFGADMNLVGKPITLNGQSVTIIGIMPPQFQFPSQDDELWVPMAFSWQEAARRGSHFLEVIARLKPGVALQQAQADEYHRGASATAVSRIQHRCGCRRSVTA